METSCEIRIRNAGLLCTALLGVFLLARSATAQEAISLDKYIPANSFLYIAIPSLPAAVEAAKAHPLALVLEDDEFKAFLRPIRDRLDTLSTQAKTEVGLTLEEMLAIPTGRIELAIMQAFARKGQPSFDFAMNIEYRGEDEKARTLWSSWVAQIENSAPANQFRDKIGDVEAIRIEDQVTGYAFLYQGNLLVTTSKPLALDVVKGRPASQGCLRNDPGWQKSAARIGADASHAFFTLDPRTVTRLAVQQAEADGDRDPPARELELVFEQVIGIETLERISGSFVLRPDGIRETWDGAVRAKRKGLFRLLDALKPGLRLPAHLDPSTVLYANGKVDITEAFDTFMDLCGDFMEGKDPEAYLSFKKGLRALDLGTFGVKLHDEFLEALGNEVWLRMGLPKSGGFVPDFLVGVSLDDAPAMIANLDKLMETVLVEGLTFSKRVESGCPVYVIQVRGASLQPAAGIVDGTLVVGISPARVVGFIRAKNVPEDEGAAKGRAPKDLLASVGLQNADPLSGLVFGDVEKVTAYVYEIVTPLISGLDPDSTPFHLDPALLPTREALTRLLSRSRPFIGTFEVTDDGVLSRLHSPISSLGLMGVLAGILEHSGNR
jgi:hypothetical protein